MIQGALGPILGDIIAVLVDASFFGLDAAKNQLSLDQSLQGSPWSFYNMEWISARYIPPDLLISALARIDPQ